MWNQRHLSSCREIVVPVSSYLFREEIVAGQDGVLKSFVEAPCSFPHIKDLAISSSPLPPPTTALTATAALYPRNVCSSGCCVVLLGRAGRAPTNRTSQRSSERFWIASATAVRRRAMTDRGSSLPITALPDTIMLAPAWSKYKQTLTVGIKNHKIWFEV